MMDTTGSHRCHRSGRSVPRRARPGLDERRGRARNRLLRVAPFWHRHLWHNINGLWRWRQNGASPPLRIYGAISERYEPKWLTGDRVRCTLFRNCSTTSIWGWRSAISAPIVAPVRQAANYVHCHRNPTKSMAQYQSVTSQNALRGSVLGVPVNTGTAATPRSSARLLGTSAPIADPVGHAERSN
jgi:hypothetical protein